MKTKTPILVILPRILALIALLLLILISRQGFLQAQQVTRGYDSDEPLERGLIVRLKDDDPTKVEPLRSEDDRHMHGVVVAPNDAPLTLSDDNNKTFVATGGHYEILVSDQNGDIQSGDYLTISSTAGIGMRADDNHPYVIGKALAAFDRASSVTGQAQVNGRTVQYGRVMSEIEVAANPIFTPESTSIPDFLQRTAEAISGKPVNRFRVYLASFITLATVLIAGTLLYAGVRSSITAIGRNPLSKLSVGKGLARVVVTGLIIFLSGLFAVYLLLKL